jgi:hypothetical protein
MWQALISPIAKLAGGYLKNRGEEKQAKHDQKMSIIKNNANWEEQMAAASGSSWKDEFWTIILAVPVVAISYAAITNDPTLVESVKESFLALDELPDWYQYLLFIAISSSFGIRGATKLMELRKK